MKKRNKALIAIKEISKGDCLIAVAAKMALECSYREIDFCEMIHLQQIEGNGESMRESFGKKNVDSIIDYAKDIKEHKEKFVKGLLTNLN